MYFEGLFFIFAKIAKKIFTIKIYNNYFSKYFKVFHLKTIKHSISTYYKINNSKKLSN